MHSTLNTYSCYVTLLQHANLVAIYSNHITSIFSGFSLYPDSVKAVSILKMIPWWTPLPLPTIPTPLSELEAHDFTGKTAR